MPVISARFVTVARFYSETQRKSETQSKRPRRHRGTEPLKSFAGMERIDVAVVGAGVTGLASALAIAERGRSVCVLERHPRAGLETSTHNSGVIHAGLYYPPGSLKARLCVEGRRLLYEFCARHGVPHARLGKLVVAAEPSEIAAIETLCTRGTENCVDGLQIVDREFIRKREPAIHAVA